MLGFAPLASTTLADDVGTQEFDLVADQVSFSIAGQDVNFLRGFSLVTEAGSFGFAGQDATVQADLNVVADASIFSLTGQDSSFSVNSPVEATSYTLTSQDAQFTRDYNLTANVGSFSLSFEDVDDQTRIVSGTGLFVSNNQDASFIITLGATDFSSISFDGQEATFTKALFLDASQGTYITTPQTVTDRTSKVGGTGSFTLGGQDIGIEYPLVAEGTDYNLSGQTSAPYILLLVLPHFFLYELLHMYSILLLFYQAFLGNQA